jgi:hypothetical protein
MPSLDDSATPLPADMARGRVPVLTGAIEANGAIYAGNRCPHCSSRLANLPVKNIKCRSCRREIVLIRGDDYVVYLLREQDAGPLRKEMDAHWALTHMVEPGWRWDPEGLRGLRRVWMVRYAALGLRVRVVLWKNDPCGPCRSLADQVFEPENAPELPLVGCGNMYCNCRYEPVIRE